MKNISIYLPLLSVIYVSCNSETKSDAERPNILWIVVEDQSSHYGYQGEGLVKTPNVDRLAAEGVEFKNAYVTSPVCSAARSAMITGMYQTSIGAHHHRSSRGTEKIHLPEGIKTIPEIFKADGYYTCNSWGSFDQKGKEDYNFEYSSDALYDGIDWTYRAEGQPFFAQVHLQGGKMRENLQRYEEIVVPNLNPSIPVKAESVNLPPYYPENQIFKDDWARYLNSVQYTDKQVGVILERLKKEDLLENTVIFFITDHGISHARGKQFLYDEGTKIPFIVYAPGRLKPHVREDLIIHIDMAATSLQLAGIEIPEYMEAKPLFDNNYVPRDYVVSARDRCDETVDHIRSVRKGNFKYIKNYLPERPYQQPNAYKDAKPIIVALRELYNQGKLDKYQRLVTATTRPEEELYDLSADPFELYNLAANEKYAETLKEMRTILEQWIMQTDDKGQYPEPETMYDSDMEVYLIAIARSRPERVEIIKENISIMKQWSEKGK